MIKPTGFHVLVEMEEVEQAITGGALDGFVTASNDEHDREQGGHDIGRVLAIGPTAHMGYEGCDAVTAVGRALQWGYGIGDRVQFDRYQGKLLDMPGYENHRIIVDVNIIANLGE